MKTWLRSRDIFVSSVDCPLRDVPETIEHCFISCRDAILFWDVLQRTLQKDFVLNPHSVRYLLPASCNDVAFDMLLLIGMHSLWKTRMLQRNAEPIISSTAHFIKMVTSAKRCIVRANQSQQEWYTALVRCLSLPLF